MRWLVNNTVIKLLVIVLCIKEIWLLLGVPSISNAIISFTTLGVIPGTDTILTPAEMVSVSLVIVVVLVSLMFRRELEDVFVRHEAYVSAQEQSADDSAAPAVPKPLVVLHESRYAQRLEKLTPARKWLSATAEFWFWSIAVALLEIARVIVTISLWLWRAAEPYIRQFDHWLDVQLHTYEPTAKALAFGSEATDDVHALFQKAKEVYETIAGGEQVDKSDQSS